MSREKGEEGGRWDGGQVQVTSAQFSILYTVASSRRLDSCSAGELSHTTVSTALGAMIASVFSYFYSFYYIVTVQYIAATALLLTS